MLIRRFKISIILLLSLIFIFSPLLTNVVQADNLYMDFGSWKWQISSGISNDPAYAKIFYDSKNNSYYIFGDNGLLKTSKDLISWSAINTNTQSRLMSYCPFKNGYVIVGLDGAVVLSQDGKAWETLNPIAAKIDNNDFVDIITNGKILVATSISNLGDAAAGAIETSIDGRNWKRIITMPEVNLKMIYSNGIFVLTGGSYTFKSKDGITWERYDADPSVDGKELQISNGTISVNGKVWTYSESEKDLVFQKLEHINESYYGMLAGSFVYSRDGVNWSISTIDGLRDFTWDGQRLVAVGHNNMIVTSEDGEQWHSYKSEALNINKADLTVVNGKFMFTSNQKLYTSADGNSWEISNVVLDGVAGASSKVFDSNILWDGQFYWAVKKNVLYQSVNAYQWTSINKNNDSHNNLITKIQYAKGEIIGVGTCGAIVRFDRTKGEWIYLHEFSNEQRNNIDDSEFIDLLYANNLYVAVMQKGTVYISKDLIKWNILKLDNWIDQISWNGKQFLIGGAGRTMISEDGYKWKSVGYMTGKVVWTKDGYFGVASAMGGSGHFLYSEDGSQWYSSKNAIFNKVNDIEFNGETIVALTDDGRVLYKKIYSNGKLLQWLTKPQAVINKMWVLEHVVGDYEAESRKTIAAATKYNGSNLLKLFTDIQPMKSYEKSVVAKAATLGIARSVKNTKTGKPELLPNTKITLEELEWILAQYKVKIGSKVNIDYAKVEANFIKNKGITVDDYNNSINQLYSTRNQDIWGGYQSYPVTEYIAPSLE